ncbi:MAG: SDR family NAD(P)-dependent oxidoreductase [Pseudomonadales bacterium]|nr:SDR family NAD(P)-dependent oxidoreductase [Pseudomonadales bacterium]NIX06795.1 SDR family NAD(P)-dependent oxidoreductase [Pseudomonadales bacterium]
MTEQHGPDRPNAVGHGGVASALVTALSDLVGRRDQLGPMLPDERLDGRTYLVTGASSGLGKALAVRLATSGAAVIMACRSGIPEAGQEVMRASGSRQIRMLQVDLADLASAAELCDRLKETGERLDGVVFNAGLMPLAARRGPQGYEEMFAVHFLSSRLIVERLLTDGVVVPTADPATRPRLVFVSSEAHRSARPIDFDHFGAFVDYGLRSGMAEYGRSKLHLCTFATELARRLASEGGPGVDVHGLCPGPVASNIAREAPGWLKPLVGPIIRWLFARPERAVEPVLLLVAGKTMQGRTGVYLHMMREKAVSFLAADAENGRRLWQASAALIEPYLKR